MIIKHRSKPRIILQLEALLQRLPDYHPKLPIINEDYTKRMAGYKGEQSIDYPLSYLNDHTFFIFHNLRLKTEKHYFQMDTLLLTHKMAIILEVKNFSGTIHFDPKFKQLIQTKDGKEVAYSYPLTQVDRQKLNFQEWLRIHKIENLEIHSLVVISNPYTIISTSPGNYHTHHKVIHKEELPTKIYDLEKSSGSTKMEERTLKKLMKLLLKNHTEGDSTILDRFELNDNDILKGVFCPICRVQLMVRLKGNWLCSECGAKDKLAHLKAIGDYQLLIKPTITNSELRDFLKIHSSDTANRLLKTLNLRSTGETKHRMYYLDNLNHVKRKQL
ncbi:nuclease-related domain-containing protein [Bacillus weihaiensis]|uniref:NERD domain-containing protein n=1 Tax=Bacillus weihaiensis TaxID=1547283 RepID=A0A1L3MN31_9BACI|nr:nuclease-related domain-containing protein [Bacillus weihaiensis]APH03674.1 hypothetical protein A9C19_02260 [Bacillus weihaiensis]